MKLSAAIKIAIAVVVCLLLLSGCSSQPAQPADAIYFGGDIITMNEAQPTAEAVAVKDGKILMVGTRADLEKNHKGDKTVMIDLGGKTLLPAFLDAHSHYINSLTVANQVNVYPPPAGPGKDVASIIAALKQYQEEKKIPAGVMIQAYGYDENVMPAGHQLNRDELDKAFPDNPVIVGHVSMHGGVLNSLALKQFGYSAATKTPEGGVIVRKPGTQEPYGLIMETAYLPVFEGQPKPTPEQEVEWSKAGQMLYAQNGITTAQEGATHAPDLAVIQRAAAGGATLIDVIAYPFILDLDKVLAANPVDTWGKYKNRVKIGGVKITSDGSPQGKTAFFTTPYLKGGPGGEKNWRGEPTFPPDMLNGMVKKVYGLNVPLLVHANGDAAIDLVLKANELATGGDLKKHPPLTMIHAQFTRPDQLDQYVAANIRPSFYTLHTFYFADAHIANRGPKQAAYISPMRDAIDKGIHPTNHTDFVVAPLDQMFMLWSAVNRISRSGEVLGPDQRVTPMEGLKAMTIWVAEQYGEQDSKGTLQGGKLADLVVLSENPLKVDKLKIKDIKVVETIKEGKSIFQAKN
ncbi:MAG TPA: amidohydrolase [Candidatus Angelobacter sp.]|nr:amidohydrolase [Candidatus Angelobacter sp.]